MNKTDKLNMTVIELEDYRLKCITNIAEAESELGKLEDSNHDCKGNEDDACNGCALIHSLETVINYNEDQKKQCEDILESDEYHFIVEDAIKRGCTIAESEARIGKTFEQEQFETLASIIK